MTEMPIATFPTHSSQERHFKKFIGVPVVTRQLENPTVSIRIQVQPLALLSGLRIQQCHKLKLRFLIGLRSGVAMAPT